MELGPKQKAWLEALRSGKYQQATGKLFTGKGYCCLGVMCVLEGKEFCVIHEGIGEEPIYCIKDTRFTGVPPDKIAVEVYGLRDNTGTPKDGEFKSLTSLNDSGTTFNQIADLLEQHPEQYFIKSV